MKKILLSILLLAAMIFNVLALAACNGGGDDDGDNGDSTSYDVQAYNGGDVTIKFYSTMGQKLTNAFTESLKDFNKMFPKIKVEHTTIGSWDPLRDRINQELAGGNSPNVSYCYPDHVAIYKDLQSVLPLDSFINSTIPVTDANGNTTIMGYTAEQQADFVKTYWDEGKVFDAAGTMYTLPMAKSTEALFYNKTFFDNFEDEQGKLSVPTTWAEMESVCERIKAKYPNSIPLGYDSESNWFITRLEQKGAGYTSIDPNNHYLFSSLTSAEILAEANEWYQKGYVVTQGTNNDTYTSNLFTLASNDAADKCFMVIGSTGGASYQEPPKANNEYLFEVGITNIPQENVNNPKVISQGPSLCIFKDSDPQKVAASWLLVKFLTTNVRFQSNFSIQSGYAPVIGAAKADPTYQSWLTAANGYNNLQALCVQTSINNEAAYFTSPAFNGSSKARSESEKFMKDIMVYTGSDVLNKAGELLAAALAACKSVGK